MMVHTFNPNPREAKMGKPLLNSRLACYIQWVPEQSELYREKPCLKKVKQTNKQKFYLNKQTNKKLQLMIFMRNKIKERNVVMQKQSSEAETTGRRGEMQAAP